MLACLIFINIFKCMGLYQILWLIKRDQKNNFWIIIFVNITLCQCEICKNGRTTSEFTDLEEVSKNPIKKLPWGKGEQTVLA